MGHELPLKRARTKQNDLLNIAEKKQKVKNKSCKLHYHQEKQSL